MFLRPPLLISIIRTKNKPVPLSIQTDKNCWHDKLRTIRYDDVDNSWLLYTSDGFYKLDNIRNVPVKMKRVPPVSVMGLNVMEKLDSTTWIIGSFSGIYEWNRIDNSITDYFTREPYKRPEGRPSVLSNPVSGFSTHFNKQIVFGYSEGATPENILPAMPDKVKNGKISLWHISLEAHVGRIYTFLPTIIQSLFVPLSGIFFLIILITGFEIYRRRSKKKKNNIRKQNEMKK